MANKPVANELPGVEASAKIIRERIKADGIAVRSAFQSVHITVAKIMTHALRFGDVSFASVLIAELGSDVRSNLLREAFETFGPFKWGDTKALDAEGKPIKGFKLDKDKKEAMQDCVADAKSIQIFERETCEKLATLGEKKPEPVYKGFNFLEQFERLIKRARAEAGKHPDKVALIDTTGIEAAEAAYYGLKAAQIVKDHEADKAKAKKPEAVEAEAA